MSVTRQCAEPNSWLSRSKVKVTVTVDAIFVWDSEQNFYMYKKFIVTCHK